MKVVPLSIVLCLLGSVVIAGAATKNVDNSADIAVIDRALATEKPGDEWIKFGDVGLTHRQLQIFRDRLVAEQQGEPSPTPQPKVVTPPTTFTWPSGNVNYRFDPTQVSNNTITTAKMQAFRDGVAEWAAFANLHFIEFTTPLPTNYITVQDDPSRTGGFSSSVGMKQTPGEQLIQIGSTSWNRGTVCHEVGHSIGLYHEQQRDDRDTYVVINTNNINTNDQGNFAKLPGGTTAIGAYDFYSIMHYSRAALTNKTGTPNPNAPDPNIDTIDPVVPTYLAFLNIMGNVYDRTLSKLDRAGMAAIYGNPAVLPSAIVTNTKDSGSGSLRAAIYYAFDKSTDAPPVPTTVTFHIPTSDSNFNAGTGVFTIKPTFLMVAPGAGTTIDGSTQTAFTGDTNTSGPEIVIDGSTLASSGLGLFASGFLLHEMNCTIKNLVINGFNQQGIVVDGTRAALFGTSANGNVISGCYIGTDRTGGVGAPNTFPGIEMFGGASNNTIGGTTTAARNVIAGNSHYGISIHDNGSTGNLIVGNYIGLNATGTAALANTASGIGIFLGAQNNTVGGTTAGARNVISGNNNQGIAIEDPGTTGNSVLGNYIGTNAAGTSAIANGSAGNYSGVEIFLGAQSNTIGGSVAGSANVISGNTGQGIVIADSGTTSNLVRGNTIGLNAAQSAALPNTWAGVSIFNGAQSNTIGGLVAGSANIISGNGNQGITISGTGTNLNLVQGNFIGTNTAGTAALGNTWSGVAIFGGAQSNTIGGLSSAARNLISGNGNQGVVIADAGTNLNLVQGNYIGVNAAGTAALPNAFSGISLFNGAQSNTIGGARPGARNIISGNTNQGMTISDSGTALNLVQGNYIGLDATGIVKIANTSTGIDIFGGAQSNVVGGTTVGARNFICGSAFYGVALSGINTNSNLIQGNTIGLNIAGSVVANGRQGVALFQAQQSDPSGPQLNFIGGSSVGASNIISGNTNEGIALFDAGTIHNTISENSIFSNGGGITLNTGSNNSQAAPTLNSAALSTATNQNGTDVSVNMSGSASTTFRIEFFATPAGGNQGEFFVGSASVNGGTMNLVVPLTAVVPSGFGVTATAAAPNGNTSAFSLAVTVLPPTDSDSDGIPDNWMNLHFMHPTGQASDNSRAGDDADGTGMTNLQKFLAGLDPTNPNSVFRISNIVSNTGNIQISFPSVAGKTYRLEYRNDLIAGSWLTLVDQIFGTGATLQIVDPGAASLSKRFYRFSLEPAQSVTTDPAGFTTTSLLSNSDTYVSIPFTRPPEFIGWISSISANNTTSHTQVITVSGAPWASNQFVYAGAAQPKHYYALIGPSTPTNGKEGHTFPVTLNSTNSVTIDTTRDDVNGIPTTATGGNTQLILIPYWTLATVFPATDANGSFTPTTSSGTNKTQIRIPKDSTPGINFPYMPVYFFSNNVDGTTSNVGWRLVGDNTTDHGDDTLAPNSYFVVRNSNGAPTLNLTSPGAVLLKKFALPLMTQAGQPLAAQQDNAVSILRPIDVALDASGLGPTDGSFVANDQLLLFNNTQVAFDKTPSAIYYYDTSVGNTGGWRLTGGGSTNHGSDVIPTGTGFIIRKAGTASGQAAFWTNEFPAVRAVSRKIHGTGTFDINLPLSGTRGVECRKPGATGDAGVDYKIIFTFLNPVTNCGAASTGSLSSGPNSNQCTVNLTGVPNAQYLTVTLTGAVDSNGPTGNVSGTMGVLIGDVNADGGASNLDVSLVKAKVAAGATVDSSNFRDDVNADGGFSNLDVSITKAQVAAGAALPTPP